MKKGVPYFPIDHNFLDNPKIVRMMAVHGPEGLTIWIGAISFLYSMAPHQFPFRQDIMGLIGRRIGIPSQKVEEFLRDQSAEEGCAVYDEKLFWTDGDVFWSDRVLRELDYRNALADRNRKNGVLGGRPPVKKTETEPKEKPKSEPKAKPSRNPIDSKIDREIDSSAVPAPAPDAFQHQNNGEPPAANVPLVTIAERPEEQEPMSVGDEWYGQTALRFIDTMVAINGETFRMRLNQSHTQEYERQIRWMVGTDKRDPRDIECIVAALADSEYWGKPGRIRQPKDLCGEMKNGGDRFLSVLGDCRTIADSQASEVAYREWE